MSKWVKGTVTGNVRWTDRLHSLQVDAPEVTFIAGQFGRLALPAPPGSKEEMLGRPYSFVNAPGTSPHEFYFVTVPDGPLSPRLAALRRARVAGHELVPLSLCRLLPASAGGSMSAVQRAARRAPYRLTPPVVPEHSLQKQITDTLRLELAPPGKVSKRGVVWWSIDHANYGGEVPGIRIGRGIVAGVPDVFLCFHGRSYMIEIKTAVGELSIAQQSVMAAVLASGGRIGVVRDADEVIALCQGLNAILEPLRATRRHARSTPRLSGVQQRTSEWFNASNEASLKGRAAPSATMASHRSARLSAAARSRAT
jgi:hypothetical protein